jgi:hypothetical protein
LWGEHVSMQLTNSWSVHLINNSSSRGGISSGNTYMARGTPWLLLKKLDATEEGSTYTGMEKLVSPSITKRINILFEFIEFL